MKEKTVKLIGVRVSEKDLKDLESLMNKWHLNSYAGTIKRAIGICSEFANLDTIKRN